MTTARTPNLSAILNTVIRVIEQGVRCVDLGEIVEYNAYTQIATVQPVIKDGVEGAAAETLPQLQNVPVFWWQTGHAWMYSPLKPSDKVLILFTDRSYDLFMHGDGEITDPQDVRRHDLSDAIALPLFGMISQPIENVDDDDWRFLLLSKDGQTLNEFYLGGDTNDFVVKPGNMIRLGHGQAAEPVIKGTDFLTQMTTWIQALPITGAPMTDVQFKAAMEALYQLWLANSLSVKTMTV